MQSFLASVQSFWDSSIGKKIVVAVTGLMLVVFLLGHLSGNLLIFVGKEAFNEYAYFLHHMLHGAGVWFARIGLLVAVVLHVIATIQLTAINRAARKSYEVQTSQRSSLSSTMMIWSGLTILAFIVYHILHFTARVGNDYNGELYALTHDGHKAHNAYLMVIHGFSWAPAVIAYVVAMICLCSHLSHGVASIFQTLGLRNKKTAGVIEVGAKLYTAVIFFGFISVPLSIFFGLVK